MRIPAISGLIRRRILLNYRIDPGAVRRVLPANFRPQIVEGYAIAGICLIRLEGIRLKGLPFGPAIASENSAHRIAVEWNRDGKLESGVFVPRRDTNSRVNAFAGGRIFPGVHRHSRFEVSDAEGKISMSVREEAAEESLLEFEAEESDFFPTDSVFASLDESSRFFEMGSIGYSSRPDSPILDGLMLKTLHWQVRPLRVEGLRSAWFEENGLFPPGSVRFDHGLLMRDICHEWHSRKSLRAQEV